MDRDVFCENCKYKNWWDSIISRVVEEINKEDNEPNMSEETPFKFSFDKDKPRVVSEDGPDLRRKRLIARLEAYRRPIKDGAWYTFCAVMKNELEYPGRDTGGDIVDYLINRLKANTVNDGLVDHLLTMVIE